VSPNTHHCAALGSHICPVGGAVNWLQTVDIEHAVVSPVHIPPEHVTALRQSARTVSPYVQRNPSGEHGPPMGCSAGQGLPELLLPVLLVVVAGPAPATSELPVPEVAVPVPPVPAVVVVLEAPVPEAPVPAVPPVWLTTFPPQAASAKVRTTVR